MNRIMPPHRVWKSCPGSRRVGYWLRYVGFRLQCFFPDLTQLQKGKYEGALSALRTTFDRLRQDKKLTASNKLISAVEKNVCMFLGLLWANHPY